MRPGVAKVRLKKSVAFREADKRLKELARRCPDTNIPAQKAGIVGMLYANVLGQATERYILGAGKEGIRGVFEAMWRAVE